MPTLNVDLGERSYPIIIERGLLGRVGGELRRLGFKGTCAVITNPTVAKLYLQELEVSLASAGFNVITVIIPDGEEFKNLAEVEKVYTQLLEARFERGAPIIALGGGVIGDMAGFIAATYLRGVPFIQLPTTLLAQVDSSVGGKTGVNHPKGKNLIGAFYQPKAVFIDPELLGSLKKRDLIAGFAEVVKYGIIWDAEFFVFLEENLSKLIDTDTVADELIYAIERSCAIKAEVVAADEREAGLRTILNLGHTFGHAIEAITNYTEFRHGEAVAIGMFMAANMSLKFGLCDDVVVSRVSGLLSAAALPTEAPDIEVSVFIEAMKIDKKVEQGRTRFVLVKELGKVVVEEVEEVRLVDFLAKLPS